MSTKQTQYQIVLNRLEKYGSISNFWAFHNYILRLGAIIYEIRQKGYAVDGAFEKKKGKTTKNYVYTLQHGKV